MKYCQARHCDKWLYFPGDKKKRFYRPYRCGEKAIKGERLCETCKNVGPGKTQLSRGFNHGLIGDLIPPNSHAYGGPWYLAACAKYGEPSKETLAEATEYLEEEFDVTAGPQLAELFRAGMLIVPKKMPRSSKERSAKKESTESAASSRKSTPSNKQAYLKDSTVTASAKLKAIPLQLTPRVIESTNEPLDVCEVEYVTVKKLETDGDNYYVNADTGAVYTITAFNKGMGERVGRYNEETEEIELGGGEEGAEDC